MRRARIAIVLFVLAVTASSCSTSPAERQMLAEAWGARDAARTAECLRNGGQFTAGGGCLFRGP
jgi:hypothetical protein